MSDTEKLTTYYGDKKYRYLTKEQSDALKELLPPSWPDRIINMVKKDLKKNPNTWPRIPGKNHLYALVNGRVRDFTFMRLVNDLALEKMNITNELNKITQKEGVNL